MKSFEIVVPLELTSKDSEMSLAEDDEVIEALVPDSPHKSLRVGIAVRAARRNRDALDVARFQQLGPRLRIQWVSVVDQVARVAKKAIHWIEEIACYLHHPRTIGTNPYSSDVHCTRSKLDHEEDHDTNGSKRAESLDGQEVASIESLPVATEKLLPGSLPIALGRRLDARRGEDVCDCRSGDLNLEAA